MAELATFEAEVRKKIKELSSKNANTRLKAAQWLGEAGEPSAITSLAQAYKNDPDARVRDAAQYSLGMFRALEEALAGDKEEETLALLQRVALEGKRGRRVLIPTRTMVRIEVVMLLLAVVLFAVGFLLPSLLNVTPTGEPTPARVATNDKDRATLLAEFRAQFTKINDNVVTLQGQYQNVLDGSEMSCQVFLNELAPLAISAQNSADFPDINTLAQQLNTTLTDLIIAQTPYNDYCNTRESLTAEAVNGPMQTLGRILTQLPQLETALTAAETLPTATVPPTEAPTVEVVVTPTLAIAPSPTLDARTHLQALQRIIDQVNAPDGASSLLKTYWEDTQQSGQTNGCNAPQPAIPEDHFLSPAEGQQNLALANAVSFVNLGLAKVRTGWTVFRQACDSGNPRFSANTGLQLAEDASSAFNDAQALFPTAMQGGG
ncbi:MAG: HEAT repeat domain-containing protein [Anaerolineaceae bacterium]|nr:HEAT repeat domain-containing protein [Anaerolineaceae bacterium]